MIITNQVSLPGKLPSDKKTSLMAWHDSLKWFITELPEHLPRWSKQHRERLGCILFDLTFQSRNDTTASTGDIVEGIWGYSGQTHIHPSNCRSLRW